MTAGTAIFVTDYSDFNADHDEYRVWEVYIGDDDGEPVGLSTFIANKFSNRKAALDFADALSVQMGNLEVVSE